MKEFPIYKSEVADGMKEKIISSMSISSTCELEICDPFTLSKGFKAVAENKNQMDLHYLKSILVTTGWNKNDDVFDRAEVWSARNTPSDKPFNLEHDQKQIIGHITGSKVVDDEGNDIAEGMAIDELPKKFHILTSAVLYKFWEDSKKQEEMNNIISEMANNKWFVSMEALFNNFDYSMDDGIAAKVIARNEKTAFLTKHLRIYGGTGLFNNVKIGRVLKNIVFSGKGLVRNPANPESIIFDETEAFVTSSVYNLDETIKSKEIIMSIEEKKEVTKVVAEIIVKTISEKDKHVMTPEEEKKMEEKEKMQEEKMEEKEKMQEENATIKKQLDIVVSELSNMKKEKQTNDRTNQVMEKLGMKREESLLLVSVLSALDNESFSTALSMQSDHLNKKLSEYKLQKSNEDVKNEDEMTKKEKFLEMINKKKEEDKEGEAKANLSVLETAEVKLDAALATSESSNVVKQVASQIASYFGSKTSATEQ